MCLLNPCAGARYLHVHEALSGGGVRGARAQDAGLHHGVALQHRARRVSHGRGTTRAGQVCSLTIY